MRLSLVFLSMFFMAPIFGANMYDLGDVTSKILRDKKELVGRWRSGDEWKGYLCNGGYYYDATLRGKVEDLRMEVEAPGTATLEANVVHVFGDLFGSYRTSELFCFPFEMGLKFWVDSVTVLLHARIDESGGAQKIKVNVIHTKFRGVRFFKNMSPQFEEFATRLVNKAFKWIWDSKLGTWIEKKLNEEINKYQ